MRMVCRAMVTLGRDRYAAAWRYAPSPAGHRS